MVLPIVVIDHRQGIGTEMIGVFVRQNHQLGSAILGANWCRRKSLETMRTFDRIAAIGKPASPQPGDFANGRRATVVFEIDGGHVRTGGSKSDRGGLPKSSSILASLVLRRLADR